ncbi:transglycosylase family protein [Mycobacterium intracellulare]|uniref:transglycosylase family protein n=1 Tax=Mycobacterium intracellulare TaxID=1767 RepID=UPI00109E58B5|nr:transglycosylase family protein [Mycobacterium intracellulare]
MSDGIKLASGFIELTVKQAGNAMRDITAEITGVGKTADKVGKQAGKAIEDGLTQGAKNAGKAINKEIGSAAEKSGKDAGKKAGDALGKEIEKASKNTKVAIPPPDTKPARDSIIRDIGGANLQAAPPGAQDAGTTLEAEFGKAAAKAGRAIGDAIGNSPIGDWARQLGIDGDHAADAFDGIMRSITGIKDKDAAGVLGGMATALGAIGQGDAANVIGDIATRAGTAQQNFSVLKGAIGGSADALKTFTGNADGAIGKIGGIAAAASAAAGPVAAFLSAVTMGQQLSADVNKKFFNGQRVAPQDGIPLTPYWFLNRGEAALNGKGWSAFNPFDSSPDTPGHGLPGSAPPKAPVQGPKPFVPQTLLPPLTPSGAPAAPSGNVTGPGVPLVQTAAGAWTSPNPAWAHLIGRESSGRNIGQQITDANGGPGSPNAAQGLFQITPATWAAHGGTEFAPNPLAATPQQQGQIAARILQSNPSGSDWGAGLPGRENAAALLQGILPTGYDDGGVLPPGMTLTNNASGQPEVILTQDQAKNALQGMPGIGAGPSDTPLSSGMSPGPNGAAALTSLTGQQPDSDPLAAVTNPGGKDLRTQGYIPAGAGGGGTAGTSLWSGAMQMGAQAVNGLIDQAASAAATAISAAATAGSFGAGGQAAGSASSFLIGIGTQAAKRGVQYGFQLAGIGGDALTEILMPFGVPRFFQTDPSQFVPKLPNMSAAVTTGEKAQQTQDNPQGAQQAGINPAGPVQPGQLPGQQVVGSPAPIAQPGTGNFTPAPVGTPGLSGPQPNSPAAPSLAPTQPVTPPVPHSGPMATPQPQPQAIPPNTQPIQPTDLGGLLNVFDTGGWLMPGGLAANMTSRPEPILSPTQFDDLHAIASRGMPELDPEMAGGGYSPDYSVRIDNVTVSDVEAMRREIDSRQRLQMMRYGGRP